MWFGALVSFLSDGHFLPRGANIRGYPDMADAENALVQKLFRSLPEMEFLKSLVFFACAIRESHRKIAVHLPGMNFYSLHRARCSPA